MSLDDLLNEALSLKKGDLIIKSVGDSVIAGANIQVSGDFTLKSTKGNVALESRHDTTEEERESYTSSFLKSTKITEKEHTAKHIGNKISVGGNLKIKAAKNVDIVGAKMTGKGSAEIEGKKVNILAGRDIYTLERVVETTSIAQFGGGSKPLNHAKNNNSNKKASKNNSDKKYDSNKEASIGASAEAKSKKSFSLYSKRIEKTNQLDDVAVVSKLNFKGKVSIEGKKEVNIEGAEIAGEKGLDIKGEVVDIYTAVDIHMKDEDVKETSLAIETSNNAQASANASASADKAAKKASAGASANASAGSETFIGMKIKTERLQTISTKNTGAKLSSGSGSVKLSAKKDLTLTSSKITAAKNITLKGENIYQLAAKDVDKSYYNSEVKKAGISSNSTAKAGANANANANTGQVSASVGAEASVKSGIGIKVSTVKDSEYNLVETAVVNTFVAGKNITRDAKDKIYDEGSNMTAGETFKQSADSIKMVEARNKNIVRKKSEKHELYLGKYVETGASAGASTDVSAGANAGASVDSKAVHGIEASTEHTYSEYNLEKSTAVVGKILSGKGITSVAKNEIKLSGTVLDSGGDIIFKAGSIKITAAHDRKKETSKDKSYKASASFGGGVAAEAGATAGTSGGGGGASTGIRGEGKMSIEVSKSNSSEVSSVAKVSKFSGNNISFKTTKGDASFEGTEVKAKGNIDMDISGNLNVTAARDNSNKKSSTLNTDANIGMSVTGLVGGSVSANAGLNYSKKDTEEASSKATVAKFISGKGISMNVVGNATFEGTKVTSLGRSTLKAGGAIKMLAAESTYKSKIKTSGAGFGAGKEVGDGSGSAANDFSTSGGYGISTRDKLKSTKVVFKSGTGKSQVFAGGDFTQQGNIQGLKTNNIKAKNKHIIITNDRDDKKSTGFTAGITYTKPDDKNNSRGLSSRDKATIDRPKSVINKEKRDIQKPSKDKYQTRIIIQKGKDKITKQAVKNLVDKLNKENSKEKVLVVSKDKKGKTKILQGDNSQIQGNTKIQVVGHGSKGKIQGKNAKELAKEIKDVLTKSSKSYNLKKVELLSCNSGSCKNNSESLSSKLENNLGNNVKVKGYKGYVGVSDKGKRIKANVAKEKRLGKKASIIKVLPKQTSDPINNLETINKSEITKDSTSEQASTSKASTSEQASTSKASTSEQASTSKASTSEQASTSKASTSEQASTSKASTSEQASTSKASTSEQASTSKASTSEQASTSDASTSKETPTPDVLPKQTLDYIDSNLKIFENLAMQQEDKDKKVSPIIGKKNEFQNLNEQIKQKVLKIRNNKKLDNFSKQLKLEKAFKQSFRDVIYLSDKYIDKIKTSTKFKKFARFFTFTKKSKEGYTSSIAQNDKKILQLKRIKQLSKTQLIEQRVHNPISADNAFTKAGVVLARQNLPEIHKKADTELDEYEQDSLKILEVFSNIGGKNKKYKRKVRAIKNNAKEQILKTETLRQSGLITKTKSEIQIQTILAKSFKDMNELITAELKDNIYNSENVNKLRALKDFSKEAKRNHDSKLSIAILKREVAEKMDKVPPSIKDAVGAPDESSIYDVSQRAVKTGGSIGVKTVNTIPVIKIITNASAVLDVTNKVTEKMKKSREGGVLEAVVESTSVNVKAKGQAKIALRGPVDAKVNVGAGLGMTYTTAKTKASLGGLESLTTQGVHRNILSGGANENRRQVANKLEKTLYGHKSYSTNKVQGIDRSTLDLGVNDKLIDKQITEHSIFTDIKDAVKKVYGEESYKRVADDKTIGKLLNSGSAVMALEPEVLVWDSPYGEYSGVKLDLSAGVNASISLGAGAGATDSEIKEAKNNEIKDTTESAKDTKNTKAADTLGAGINTKLGANNTSAIANYKSFSGNIGVNYDKTMEVGTSWRAAVKAQLVGALVQKSGAVTEKIAVRNIRRFYATSKDSKDKKPKNLNDSVDLNPEFNTPITDLINFKSHTKIAKILGYDNAENFIKAMRDYSLGGESIKSVEKIEEVINEYKQVRSESQDMLRFMLEKDKEVRTKNIDNIVSITKRLNKDYDLKLPIDNKTLMKLNSKGLKEKEFSDEYHAILEVFSNLYNANSALAGSLITYGSLDRSKSNKYTGYEPKAKSNYDDNNQEGGEIKEAMLKAGNKLNEALIKNKYPLTPIEISQHGNFNKSLSRIKGVDDVPASKVYKATSKTQIPINLAPNTLDIGFQNNKISFFDGPQGRLNITNKKTKTYVDQRASGTGITGLLTEKIHTYVSNPIMDFKDAKGVGGYTKALFRRAAGKQKEKVFVERERHITHVLPENMGNIDKDTELSPLKILEHPDGVKPRKFKAQGYKQHKIISTGGIQAGVSTKSVPLIKGFFNLYSKNTHAYQSDSYMTMGNSTSELGVSGIKIMDTFANNPEKYSGASQFSLAKLPDLAQAWIQRATDDPQAYSLLFGDKKYDHISAILSKMRNSYVELKDKQSNTAIEVPDSKGRLRKANFKDKANETGSDEQSEKFIKKLGSSLFGNQRRDQGLPSLFNINRSNIVLDGTTAQDNKVHDSKGNIREPYINSTDRTNKTSLDGYVREAFPHADREDAMNYWRETYKNLGEFDNSFYKGVDNLLKIKIRDLDGDSIIVDKAKYKGNKEFPTVQQYLKLATPEERYNFYKNTESGAKMMQHYIKSLTYLAKMNFYYTQSHAYNTTRPVAPTYTVHNLKKKKVDYYGLPISDVNTIEEASTSDASTSEQASTSKASTSKQASTSKASTSKQASTSKASTSKQASTSKASTSEQASTSKASTSKQASTSKASTSEQASTSKASTSEQASTSKASTSEQASTSKANTSKQASTSANIPPQQTSDLKTPKELTKQQENKDTKADTSKKEESFSKDTKVKSETTKNLTEKSQVPAPESQSSNKKDSTKDDKLGLELTKKNKITDASTSKQASTSKSKLIPIESVVIIKKTSAPSTSEETLIPSTSKQASIIKVLPKQTSDSVNNLETINKSEITKDSTSEETTVPSTSKQASTSTNIPPQQTSDFSSKLKIFKNLTKQQENKDTKADTSKKEESFSKDTKVKLETTKNLTEKSQVLALESQISNKKDSTKDDKLGLELTKKNKTTDASTSKQASTSANIPPQQTSDFSSKLKIFKNLTKQQENKDTKADTSKKEESFSKDTKVKLETTKNLTEKSQVLALESQISNKKDSTKDDKLGLELTKKNKTTDASTSKQASTSANIPPQQTSDFNSKLKIFKNLTKQQENKTKKDSSKDDKLGSELINKSKQAFTTNETKNKRTYYGSQIKLKDSTSEGIR